MFTGFYVFFKSFFWVLNFSNCYVFLVLRLDFFKICRKNRIIFWDVFRILRKFTFDMSRRTSKNRNYFGSYSYLKKSLKFVLSSQYLPHKWTKKLHLEVVLCIILMSFMLFIGKNFNIYIVNIRSFYATNKNKLSIIIWQPTVIIHNNFSKINTHLK